MPGIVRLSQTNKVVNSCVCNLFPEAYLCIIVTRIGLSVQLTLARNLSVLSHNEQKKYSNWINPSFTTTLYFSIKKFFASRISRSDRQKSFIKENEDRVSEGIRIERGFGSSNTVIGT